MSKRAILSPVQKRASFWTGLLDQAEQDRKETTYDENPDFDIESDLFLKFLSLRIKTIGAPFYGGPKDAHKQN